MTTRLGAIIAAAIGFSLTLALIWPRTDSGVPSEHGRVTALSGSAPQDKDRLPWAHVQLKPSTEQQPLSSGSHSGDHANKLRDVRSAEHDSPSATPDFTPYVAPQPDVPVTLQWERNTDPILHNMSAEPLHVSVNAENPATGKSSTVVVTLDGHEAANLKDSGLVYQQGDQITLQSPSYADRVAK